MKKITITVAENMSNTTYERITKGMTQKYGEAEFEKITDNRIIGGFIAEADGMVVDMSIASQLKRLKRLLDR